MGFSERVLTDKILRRRLWMRLTLVRCLLLNLIVILASAAL